jgi:hypothetical protein
MKATIFAVLALSAISVAAAVTVTAYSDAACATLAANPVLGLANPSTANLNTCTKSFTVGAQTFYVKYTACSATAATTNTYTDAACTVCQGTCTPSNDVPDKCIPSGGGLTGVGSYKVACSSASTSTVAFVSAVAAALAFCI